MNPKNLTKNTDNKDRPPHWITIILGVFALLISAIAAHYADRQVNIAERSNHANLRAYVAVINPKEDVYQPKEKGKKGEPFIWISVVNFGKSPARNVEVQQVYEKWNRGILAFDPTAWPRNNIEYMIAPGETFNIPVRPFKSLWIDDTAHERQIYGIVYYVDYMDVPYKTVFAYQWEEISHSYKRMAKYNYGD